MTTIIYKELIFSFVMTKESYDRDDIYSYSDEENERNVAVQLYHFFNRSKAIHFSLISGEWRNAIILEIDEQAKKVYIKEFVIGKTNYRFSDIDSNSIEEYHLGDKEKKS